MSAHDILMSAAGNSNGVATYVDDVFSTYLYTGTGAAQTITNCIDLAGKGGLVWMKTRDIAVNNCLFDTVNGTGFYLSSNQVFQKQTTTTGMFTSFNSNGFSLGADPTGYTNYNWPSGYASWTFRKQPKFFDVVSYTGTGSNTTIAHSLGSVPGMIIVKRTDTTGAWQIYHRSLANTEYLVLNTTAAKATGATRWNSTTPTSAVFSLGTDVTVNASGGTYVAYIYAHDAGGFGLTGIDNVISCGSFTQVSAGIDVTLGWEPQYILYKDIGTGGYDWQIVDSMRGFTTSTADKQLQPNTSAAETSNNVVGPIATGFHFDLRGGTYIYMAIRRPNKPPTTGTQVYNAIARTGTGAAATVTGVGFAPDFVHGQQRAAAGWGGAFADRLRGKVQNYTFTTGGEGATTDAVLSFDMDGISLGADAGYCSFNSSAANIGAGTSTYIHHYFKRAPGFFDEVCYTGTGAATTVAHNLGVVPELILVKGRSTTANWLAYVASFSDPTGNIVLNSDAAKTTGASYWNSTGPTSTVFNLGAALGVNTSGATYVAYLFATLAGVSKVGSYTGNGTSQTIACGFSAGARFVLIKRTDSTGDWYVWDTARGIVTANDPYLSLNTTAAEVTTNDSIDPDSSGFIVNQLAATNINVSAATYIFLAIA